MSRRKVRVTSKSKHLTYVWLYESARYAAELALSEAEGSFYQSMNSIIMTAICIESYINHVGDEQIAYWDMVERKLSPENKLHILEHHLDLRIDFSRRPFQTFKAIIKFRNAMAHGRTETLQLDRVQSMAENERVPYPHPDWYGECDPQVADRYLKDAASMIKFIHEKAGHGRAPFVSPFMGSASISDVPTD